MNLLDSSAATAKKDRKNFFGSQIVPKAEVIVVLACLRLSLLVLCFVFFGLPAFAQAPAMTTQPQSQTIVAGTNVVLSVAVSGTGPFSYQWQFNGVNLPGVISTVAGNGVPSYSGDGGTATDAELYVPLGVAVDGSGNLFIADTFNERIREVDSNGIITTVAGTGDIFFSGNDGQATNTGLYNPTGVAVDDSSNLFIADFGNQLICKVTPNGLITAVAGNGTSGYSGDGSLATNAELYSPSAVAVDAAGNLFIADTGNQRIRDVAPNGIITTVAGDGAIGYSGDGGAATNAELSSPQGVAVDGFGNLFIADTGNSCIRKVTRNGIISTFAGTGTSGNSGDGGEATNAQLSSPAGVATDGAGNLLIADTANSCIRKVGFNGVMSTVAGNGAPGYSGDGLAATSAELDSPNAVTVDGSGNLFIADTYNQRVRRVTAQGPELTFESILSAGGNYQVIVTSAYGSVTSATAVINVLAPPVIISPFKNVSALVGAQATFSVDVTGTPPLAYQWLFSGTNLDDATNASLTLTNVQGSNAGSYAVVVTNSEGSVTGVVATLAVGSIITVTTQPSNQTVFVGTNLVLGVAVSGTGPFNYQWQFNGMNLPGNITTLAGSGEDGFSGDGSGATNAELSDPFGVAVDGSGNLFIADSGNQRIRKVAANGIITTVAGNGTVGYSGDGGAATNAALNYPQGLAVDGLGNLFVADTSNACIRKVAPNGIITTVAGNGTFGYSGDGGLAANAALNNPESVAVDGLGSLFIADTDNSRIRKVNPSGIIATVAGDGTFGFSGDDSTATIAALDHPFGAAVDDSGNLFIADTYNQRIREVAPNGIITTVAGDGIPGYFGNGWPAVAAEMHFPESMVVDASDNLVFADSDNERIRKIYDLVFITTVAGDGTAGYSGDGGAATLAELNNPEGVAMDDLGNLFIADAANNRVRQVGQSPTLTLTSVLLSNSGNYDVVITSPYESITSAVATVTVAQANPVVKWTNPAPIIYGTPLSSKQLNATASVQGSFYYTPGDGTVLDSGSNTLSAIFTPYDATDYTSATNIVPMEVLPATMIVAASNASRAFGQTNPLLTGNITGLTNGDPVTATYSCSATAESPIGAYTVVPALVDPNDRQTNYTVSLVNGWLSVTDVTVTNTSDSGSGSLRQAIETASAPGGGVIRFGVEGTITLTSGPLEIGTNLVIYGPGASNLAIVADSSTAFVIDSGASNAVISGLSILNSGTFGESGGGIYNAGALVLRQCIISGCLGEMGGGIYNDGFLSAVDCSIEDNDCICEGYLFFGGGGIYNAGMVYMHDCSVSYNQASASPVNVFQGAEGGGVFNTGVMTVWNSVLNGNTSGGGWSDSGGAGNGGVGGGLCNYGVVSMTSCTISSNACGSGGSGAEEYGYVGGMGGSGGGIYNSANLGLGSLSLTNCAIIANLTGVGGDGSSGDELMRGGPGSNGGNGGDGGGIWVSGTAILCNCVVGENVTSAGGDGGYAFSDEGVPFPENGGGGGYGGNGGGVYFANGSLTLINCTISENTTGPGGAGGAPYGAGTPGSNGGGGAGGGLNGGGELLNTIVASNNATGSGSDVSGEFMSMGHNLITDASGASGFTNADLLGVAPLLGPLTNNGGPILSYALLSGSPAFGAGTTNGAPLTDQRGVPRPQAQGIDIGAFESMPSFNQPVYLTAFSVSTLAGVPTVSGPENGTGEQARFNGPAGVGVYNSSNIYVADTGNDTVRAITNADSVTTSAGVPGISGSTDGTGTNARFFLPHGLAVDSVGNIYVADSGNSVIRKIASGAVVSTIAGDPKDPGNVSGMGAGARFYSPQGIALAPDGALYVTDVGDSTIHQILYDGTNYTTSTIAGQSFDDDFVDGAGPNARFHAPSCIVADVNTNLYVGDFGNRAIRKLTLVDSNWMVTTIAGTPVFGAGQADGAASYAQFNTPSGIAVDAAANVYVADSGNDTIRELAVIGGNWMVSTVAGVPGLPGASNGTGSGALFSGPTSLVIDNAGTMYIADTGNDTIRSAAFSQYGPSLAMTIPPLSNNATLVVNLLSLNETAQIGANWRFPWELAWRTNGSAATNLAVGGNYPVEFSTVPGYLAIPDEVLTGILAEQTNFVTGNYYPTITPVDTNTGGSLEVLFQTNAPSGAAWQILGDSNPFLPSGFTTNLPAGNYLIDFSNVANYVHIPLVSVQVSVGTATVIQEIYQAAQAAPPGFLLPKPVLAGQITNETQFPYGFNGQIVSDVGYGSGVAVAPNVVLTAAHLVFNDQTSNFVSNVWWFPQQDVPESAPQPQAAQGWMLLSNYVWFRSNELAGGVPPDQSIPQSQNFDVAVLYFSNYVAGGGYAGYLPSDSVPNPWLSSGSMNKMLVGYPVDASMFQGLGVTNGDMYEIGPETNALTQASAAGVTNEQVYTAGWFLTYPGDSGGPLYVELNGYFYPAGVYLGTLYNGTEPYASTVRAIDSDVVNLITNAQVLVETGTNHSGGGVDTISGEQGIADRQGGVLVTIAPPAAFQAGGAWKFTNLSDSWYSTRNPSTLQIDSTNSEQLKFTNLPGWNLPSNQSVTVRPMQVVHITNYYTLMVAWPALSSNVYGTPLGSNQLNATVPALTNGATGSFVYTRSDGTEVDAGTVLDAGSNSLSATFTPADTEDYGSASAMTNAELVVTPAPLTVTASNAVWVIGQPFPPLGGTSVGVTNNDNITATFTRTVINGPPGTYTNAIVPSLVDPNDRQTNYAVTFVDGTLTIVAAPAIQSVSQSGDVFTLTWSTTSNAVYQIESTTNLSANNWTNFGAPVTATNSTATATDFISNSQSFYRVVLLP